MSPGSPLLGRSGPGSPLLGRSGPGLPLLALVFGVFGVFGALVAGCPQPPGPFATPCNDASECQGLQCRFVDGLGQRCVPPRTAGEIGERCDNALPARSLEVDFDDPEAVLVDELVFFGDAQDDIDVCGVVGQPDVSLTFRLERDAGLSITVDDPDVTVALRRIDEGGCGDVVRQSCGTRRDPALVPTVLQGDYEIVFDGAPADRGTALEHGVRVVVKLLPCPVGYLPFDADECIGFRTMQSLLRARRAPGVGIVDDRQIAIVGGVGRDQGVRSDGEMFDNTSESLRFIDGLTGRTAPLVFGVGSSVLAAGGAPESDDVEAAVEIMKLSELDDASFISSGFTDVYDVVQLRAPVLIGDSGLASVFTSVRHRPCNGGLLCPPGASCLEGACFCIDPGCVEEVRLRVDDATYVDLADDVRAAAVGSDRLLLSDGNRAVGFRQFTAGASGALQEGRAVPGPTRGASGLVVVGRYVYAIGGIDLDPDDGLDDGIASAAIERIDPLAGETVTVGSVSQPVADLRPQVLRERYIVAFVGGDVVDVFDTLASPPRLLRVPPLPIARTDAGVVVDRDGVLFVGGVDGAGAPISSIQRLELVERNAPPPPPPPPVCVAAPVTFGALLAGTTGGATDRFREDLCNFRGNLGDDHWVVQLDTPASIEIVVDDADNRDQPFEISVSSGLCDEQHPVVACDFSVVSVAELPAGTWYIAVESTSDLFADELDVDGRPYTLRVLRGAPGECVGDEAEPADNDPLGATLLVSVDGVPTASRSLCPGDVDHVLLSHLGGGLSDVIVTGVDAGVATVASATIDAEASVAAGSPVVVAVGGFEPLGDWSARPAGFYVVALGPIAGLQTRIGWTLDVQLDCAPDAFDSLIPGLDDASDLSKAPRLRGGDAVLVTQCGADRDVVIVDPDRPGELLVDIDLSSATVEFFAIDGDRLGAPLDLDAVVNDFGDVALRLSQRGPFALRFTADEDGDGDAQVSLTIPPPGDACETALPLPAGGGSLPHQSGQFRADIDAADVGGCTGYRTAGEDIVYGVALAAGARLTATLTPDGDSEVAIYLLDACPAGDFADVCRVGDDSGGRGEADGIVFVNGGAAADFFLVLDSFFGEPWSGTLTWTIE